MKKTLKPHPNLLKVYHSYYWFLVIFLLFYLNFSEFSLFLKFSIFFIFLALVLLRFHFMNKILQKEYIFEIQKRSIFYKNESFPIEKIKFSSFFLEKAYGIGTVLLGKNKFRGISFEDFQNLLKKINF